MATPIFLTPGDAKILAKLIEREKSVPSTTAPRTPLDMQWTEGQDGPSPRTYIAVPQEVVPGATSDKISFGICDVYQIDELAQQMYPAGFEIDVYNPNAADLPTDPIGITRDKFGKWIPLGGGGDSGVWALEAEGGSRFGRARQVPLSRDRVAGRRGLARERRRPGLPQLLRSVYALERQHPPDQGQHRQTVEGFAAGCEFVVAVVRPSAILLVLFVRQRRRSDVRLR
jgi:hypothetical protein